MKTLLVAGAFFALALSPVLAQTATSGSTSNAGASASAGSSSQSGAVSVSGGGNASAGNVRNQNSNSISFGKQQKQAPGIGLAGLAVGGLSCRGSATVGVSFPGGGFGVGSTVADDECERRQWAGMLAGARDPRARALAWAIMQRSVIVQQALADTGYGAPVGVVGYRDMPGVRGGNARVTASGCTKWAGGNIGGQCLY